MAALERRCCDLSIAVGHVELIGATEIFLDWRGVLEVCIGVRVVHGRMYTCLQRGNFHCAICREDD